MFAPDPEPDISRTLEDFDFIVSVEEAILNDLRKFEAIGDVLWHYQSPIHHVFRVELDPILSDEDQIIEALSDGESETLQLGASMPYKKDGHILVSINRPTPGPVYTSDEPDVYEVDDEFEDAEDFLE